LRFAPGGVKRVNVTGNKHYLTCRNECTEWSAELLEETARVDFIPAFVKYRGMKFGCAEAIVVSGQVSEVMGMRAARPSLGTPR
jgi:hypothetical protein